MRFFIQQSRIAFEDKLVRLALLIGGLPSLIMLILLYQHSMSIHAKITLTLFVFLVIAYGAFLLRNKVVSQLQTSTNLMEAMVNGDYSMRANYHQSTGALIEFNQLINSLAETLNEQRLISKEKQVLLHKVIAQIDVAILAVDAYHYITLMNPAAEKLFNCPFSAMEGMSVNRLGLQAVLENEFRRVVEFEVAASKKKVYLHTDTFFENGNQNKLIFITDIQKILHEEERLAWQKLLRVLSHEINNSLAPISSISDSLLQLVKSNESLTDIKDDLLSGLEVVTERSHSLENFIDRYQQLYRLPVPEKTLFDVKELLVLVKSLYEEVNISLNERPHLVLFADKAQMQQVLVNLIKNAIESVIDTSEPDIMLDYMAENSHVIIEVKDNGMGIYNSENLFVPYYSTKSQGCGIGLALSRQIIANHGGELSLHNRQDRRGAIARIYIPVVVND